MDRIIFWYQIAIKELRFRTLVLMVVFESVGYFSTRPTKNISLNFVLIALVLATQYMSATAFNDVSDFEIDKLNIPKDNSRPLMTMNISKKQLTIFAYSFLITSIILSLLI